MFCMVGCEGCWGGMDDIFLVDEGYGSREVTQEYEWFWA